MTFVSPQPPYSNRPTKLIEKTHNRVLWSTKYGSKTYWLITDYAGQMIDPYPVGFRKKREALAAWESLTQRRNPKLRVQPKGKAMFRIRKHPTNRYLFLPQMKKGNTWMTLSDGWVPKITARQIIQEVKEEIKMTSPKKRRKNPKLKIGDTIREGARKGKVLAFHSRGTVDVQFDDSDYPIRRQLDKVRKNPLEHTNEYEGRWAENRHMTSRFEGWADPKLVVKIPGKMGEEELFRRSRSGRMSAAKWKKFKKDLEKNTVRYGVLIIVEWDDQFNPVAHIYEGNHRARAAVELDIPIPVEIRFFGESQKTGISNKNLRLIKQIIKEGKEFEKDSPRRWKLGGYLPEKNPRAQPKVTAKMKKAFESYYQKHRYRSSDTQWGLSDYDRKFNRKIKPEKMEEAFLRLRKEAKSKKIPLRRFDREIIDELKRPTGRLGPSAMENVLESILGYYGKLPPIERESSGTGHGHQDMYED